MKSYAGFTLLELMITLVIVSILAVIAIPAYTNHVTKTRRAEGQVALLDLAARMERFYAQNNSYVGANIANTGAASPTENGFYALTIPATTASTFSIQAAPQGVQAADDGLCATLSLNQLGVKGESGTGSAADCW